MRGLTPSHLRCRWCVNRTVALPRLSRRACITVYIADRAGCAVQYRVLYGLHQVPLPVVFLWYWAGVCGLHQDKGSGCTINRLWWRSLLVWRVQAPLYIAIPGGALWWYRRRRRMGNAFSVFVPYVSGTPDGSTDSAGSASKGVVGVEEGHPTVESSVEFNENAVNTILSPRELRRRRRLGEGV